LTPTYKYHSRSLRIKAESCLVSSLAFLDPKVDHTMGYLSPLNSVLCRSQYHGRRSRGTSPPEFGVGETLMQIVPLRFCHIGTKRSILWPSKYAKIRFRPWLCPEPCWGAPPDPIVGWMGHPFPYPTPLGTDSPSALAMRPRSTPMLNTSTMTVLSIGRSLCLPHTVL